MNIIRYISIIFLCAVTLSIYAEKRALVIGIGKYPSTYDNYWSEINGDNDVAKVCEMLVENGFKTSNIIKLINDTATYYNIKKELRRLEKISTKGDVIYIHFSGHGQLITDMNGDEPSGFDEAWIPYDAQKVPSETYFGQYHLIDDDLNRFLHCIKDSIGEEGKILVVSDACHSAGGSRAITEEAEIRGTSARFNLNGNVKPFNKKNINKERWLFLAACGSLEYNCQCIINENQYGSLTYSLYMLKDKLYEMNAQSILESVKDIMHKQFRCSQTPVLDGPKELIKTNPFK